ncbi:MAG: RNB domain-containing ribonuclease [Bacilli bacterium]|nr:RNB domain-containing ribonuclease [Bacilli bacterium]
MKVAERALKDFMKGSCRRLTSKELIQLAKEDPDELVDAIFQVINEELDKITDGKSLVPIREVLTYITVLVGTKDMDRDLIMRKLYKLDIKIDRIQLEKEKKLKNPQKVHKELEELKKDLEEVEKQVEEQETKQYEFIQYLLDEVKNPTYLEFTLERFPYFLSIKDKEGTSLFQHIISKYLKSIEKQDWNNSSYYHNVLSLFFLHDSFSLEEKDKKDILNHFYHTINRLTQNKEDKEKYQNALKEMRSLVSAIKDCSHSVTSDIEKISQKYNIPVYFDRKTKEEVSRLSPKLKNRSLIKDYTITIDGEGTVEIDDALSCKKLKNGNYLLGVHIASVLGYYPYESEIVDAAIERGSSIYLPRRYQTRENDFQKLIPLFPYEFSTYIASLVEKESRLARSYFFELARDGTIVSENFLKTTVVNQKRTTFREIDDILEHGSSNKRLQETVFNLQKVTELLDKRYRPSTLYEQMKENSPNYSDLIVGRIGAEKIVYQAMLLTGNRVAEYFADSKRDYPFLYRVHEIKKEHIEEIQRQLKDLGKTYQEDQYQKLFQEMNGTYPKGWYARAGSHYGLRVAHHCHCTSNLRRGADIVDEHALEVCYDKEPTDKELKLLEQEIERRAIQINAKEKNIECFLKDYKKNYQKRR